MGPDKKTGDITRFVEQTQVESFEAFGRVKLQIIKLFKYLRREL